MDSGLFVMTVHQAKGKEFDCVIVADASSRYWRDDEENRRLFYVALTRASKSWVIVAPDSNATPLLAYLK
jgi:superfamily I DNA/RNA helicase